MSPVVRAFCLTLLLFLGSASWQFAAAATPSRLISVADAGTVGSDALPETNIAAAAKQAGQPDPGAAKPPPAADLDLERLKYEYDIQVRKLTYEASQDKFRLASYLTILVVVFGIVTFLIIWASTRGTASSDQFLRSSIIILIIVSSLILIVAGYSNEQIAPAFGLFGTIVGYMLGRLNQSTDTGGRGGGDAGAGTGAGQGGGPGGGQAGGSGDGGSGGSAEADRQVRAQVKDSDDGSDKVK